MSEVIKNRYEFVVLFDVENGNPNGDPDAGNMPRIDPESGLGLVTDVCLKRKIRNYVETVKEDAQGYKIYIKEDVPLNRSDRTACENVGIKETDDKKVTEALKKLKKSDPGVDSKLRDYMCENYYDIRTFGAVMTTFVKASLNCGQVRGPVQLGFARSIDPVISQEVTITRVAITTKKMPKIKVPKWEERVLCHMHCIAQRALYLQILHEKQQDLQKKIWNFCGMRS